MIEGGETPNARKAMDGIIKRVVEHGGTEKQGKEAALKAALRYDRRQK